MNIGRLRSIQRNLSKIENKRNSFDLEAGVGKSASVLDHPKNSNLKVIEAQNTIPNSPTMFLKNFDNGIQYKSHSIKLSPHKTGPQIMQSETEFNSPVKLRLNLHDQEMRPNFNEHSMANVTPNNELWVDKI
jgi:hypothetical protein